MEKKNLIFLDELHIPIILLDILKNAWLVVLAILSVCIGVFAYGNLAHQNVYATEATFAVSPQSNGAYVGFYSSLNTANEMAGVFQEVFSSDVLKRLIREDLGEPGLAFTVRATVAENTNILCITVQADSPENAHKVMQSLLKNYGRVSQYLFGSVVLDILKKPQISVAPANPFNTTPYIALGCTVAVFLMVLSIAVLSVLRPTAKTIACAKRRMGQAPLAVLQKEKKRIRLFRKQQKKPLLITHASTSFFYTESILQLAHKLRYKMRKADKKVLLVTSVAENEGKSTVSANLALALAKHGCKVALVDMDLRKPAIYKIFRSFPGDDLITCLHEGAPDSWDASKRLHLVHLRKPCSGTDKLLHSKELDALMKTLREKMDFVILDSSPYTVAADTGMLLRHADSYIMVMRQDWAPVKVCRDVAEDLNTGNATYLGYVMNHYLDGGTAQGLPGHYDKYGKYGKYGDYSQYEQTPPV